MSVPQISFVAREYVRTRLEDVSPTKQGFNYLIQQTSDTYKVDSFSLRSALNTTLDARQYPINLYLGSYEGASMNQLGILQFPSAVLSVGLVDSSGSEAFRITPSTFAGMIVIGIEFYYEIKTGSAPIDADAEYFALEDALTSTFNSAISYSLVPGGLIYNNEIRIRPGKLETTTSKLLRKIPALLIFHEVTGIGNT